MSYVGALAANIYVWGVCSLHRERQLPGLERLYLDPLLKVCHKLWPRWKMQFNRRFGNRRLMTREDKAKEEMEWRRINEAIELDFEGIEPLMDSYSVYSTEVAGMLCTPILNIFLMAFRDETQIPFLYGIRETDMVFYTFFNFYINGPRCKCHFQALAHRNSCHPSCPKVCWQPSQSARSSQGV